MPRKDTINRFDLQESGDFGGCLTVKNQWELLTGDDGVGIMKIVTMVNGKDVLWSTYTLRITNSENFIRLTRQQMRAFRRGRGGGTLVTYFTALSHWSST